MYISLSSLFLGILVLLGLIALGYLIFVLHKTTILISSITKCINRNEHNIDKLCDNLPTIGENITAISNNFKDVSDVVTETTADVIVAKESLFNNLDVLKNILNIIVSVFSK